MKYMGIAEGRYSQLIKGKDPKVIESYIIGFIVSLKERQDSSGSQKISLSALLHFYSYNDIMLNRKKLSAYLLNDDIIEPTYDGNNDDDNNVGSNNICDSGDKPYTHEQIVKSNPYWIRNYIRIVFYMILLPRQPKEYQPYPLWLDCLLFSHGSVSNKPPSDLISSSLCCCLSQIQNGLFCSLSDNKDCCCANSKVTLLEFSECHCSYLIIYPHQLH
jgi:hypothetical protein